MRPILLCVLLLTACSTRRATHAGPLRAADECMVVQSRSDSLRADNGEAVDTLPDQFGLVLEDVPMPEERAADSLGAYRAEFTDETGTHLAGWAWGADTLVIRLRTGDRSTEILATGDTHWWRGTAVTTGGGRFTQWSQIEAGGAPCEPTRAT